MNRTTLTIAMLAVLYGCGGGGGGSDGTTTPAGDSGNSAPTADAGADRTVNVGEVVTLDGALSRDIDGDTLEYTWGMVSTPEGAPGFFEDTDTSTPYLVNTRPGEYVVSLVVGDGSSNSAPDEQTITVLDLGGNAPSRMLTQPEVNAVAQFAVDHTRARMRSPSSFRVEGAPRVVRFVNTGKPDQGAVTFRYSADNVFGVRLENTALCPINWDGRGYWRNTLSRALTFCFL